MKASTKAGLVAVTLVALAVTACGHPEHSADLRSRSEPSPAAAPAQHHAKHHSEQREHLTQPVALPKCDPSFPSPHFDTPDPAMRYLASAWNRNDGKELCTVTNPNARQVLADMHREAINLRLARCKHFADGTYECTFRHDYPASMHKKGIGHAYLHVAPADRPGWYMSVFEGCG